VDVFFNGEKVISERKKYIIHLFLKRCTDQNIMKSHIEFSLKLMEQRYDISEEKLLELQSKYNLDDYIERLLPYVDKQFTIEEMQTAIKFFSSGVGKKMLDKQFLSEIGKVGNNMVSQAEREFAINDRGSR